MSTTKQDIIHGDRRSDRRYELSLQLRFHCSEWPATRIECGHTLELSRGGVRFLTESAPPDGSTVEVRIQWPFLLQGVCPLELRVGGAVLRTDSRGTVVRISKYEFRTCGRNSFDEVEGERLYSFVA